MTRERLIILMGSKSDLSFASQIGAFLAEEGFRIQCEYGVASAHRTPEMLLEKMRKNEMEEKDMRFFICKKCGKFDTTESSIWKVERNKEGYSELFCPVCDGKEFIKLEMKIEL